MISTTIENSASLGRTNLFFVFLRGIFQNSLFNCVRSPASFLLPHFWAMVT